MFLKTKRIPIEEIGGVIRLNHMSLFLVCLYACILEECWKSFTFCVQRNIT